MFCCQIQQKKCAIDLCNWSTVDRVLRKLFWIQASVPSNDNGSIFIKFLMKLMRLHRVYRRIALYRAIKLILIFIVLYIISFLIHYFVFYWNENKFQWEIIIEKNFYVHEFSIKFWILNSCMDSYQSDWISRISSKLHNEIYKITNTFQKVIIAGE